MVLWQMTSCRSGPMCHGPAGRSPTAVPERAEGAAFSLLPLLKEAENRTENFSNVVRPWSLEAGCPESPGQQEPQPWVLGLARASPFPPGPRFPRLWAIKA